MHGGQSFAFFDRDMADFFVDASDNEAYQACEAFIYNLNSMHSRAGSQVPFSSLNIGTDMSDAGRKVTKNILLAYKAGLGKGENPIFPNIIFKVKDGVNGQVGDPNYDLFKLACEVAAIKLNPTFSFMDASLNKQYTGDSEVAYMGCRTRVIANINGSETTDKRGNLSFTTLNLPRLAIESKGSIEKFFTLLEIKSNLIFEQLNHRYNVQKKLLVRDMPFIMGQGLYLDSEKLSQNDNIEESIKHGSMSIGFIGLAETLIALTSKHHGEDDEVYKLGLNIIKTMRDFCDRETIKRKLNIVLLATPAEGLSGRFLRIDRKQFGIIPGVTDKDYYTNSFHIPVGYKISWFKKIMLEGVFHKFCNGGHITYIEADSPFINNTEALINIIKHMKDCDVGYGGLNFPVDFCCSCNYSGVYPKDCPSCGSEDINRVRRITGYLSTINMFNSAKKSELKDRGTHI